MELAMFPFQVEYPMDFKGKSRAFLGAAGEGQKSVDTKIFFFRLCASFTEEARK
ncbi:hypothetical protein ACWJKU_11935 [Methylocaldum sp. MU1018]